MMDKNSTVALDAKELLKKLSSTEKEAEDRPAALLVVGGTLNGTLFDLDIDEVKVGRNPDNQIPLEFKGISRYHFSVLKDGDGHRIEDKDSRNGTFLNNQKIVGDKKLAKGDIIKLGDITLKYLPKGDTERLTYEKLGREANMDRHTGCYNKTYFNKALELQLKKSRLKGVPLSLIIFRLRPL